MGENLMEEILGSLVFFIVVVFGFSSYLDSNEQKDVRIHQLETQLQKQEGSHMAEIAFAEKQAAIYQGCKKFFNLCRDGIRDSGERRLKEGYTGTTSGWYWAGYLTVPACIASAIGAFLAGLYAVFNLLHLKAIEPKREEVEQKQHLIDTAEERAKATHLRTNELEKRNGMLRRDNHMLAHPQKIKKPPLLINETDLEIVPKVHNDHLFKPPPAEQNDY